MWVVAEREERLFKGEGFIEDHEVVAVEERGNLSGAGTDDAIGEGRREKPDIPQEDSEVREERCYCVSRVGRHQQRGVGRA